MNLYRRLALFGAVIFSILGFPGLILSSSVSSYFPPSGADGQWRKNTDPEFVKSLGVDPEVLKTWGEWQLQQPTDPRFMSAIVIKNGWVISENHWNPEVMNTAVNISSIGKTVALVLFGIVFDDAARGRIENTFSPQSKLYHPDWMTDGISHLSDPAKSEILVSQVLNHTSGLCPDSHGCSKIFKNGSYKRADNLWSDYTPVGRGTRTRARQNRQALFPAGTSG